MTAKTTKAEAAHRTNGAVTKRQPRKSAGHSSDTILSAHGIVNRFGAQVVHDRLSLDVRRGEVLGIAGGSGSGKSVLLRTLSGMRKPDAGTVKVEGRGIDAVGDAEKAFLFGVLFQQGALFSSLSVAENVLLPLRQCTRLPREEQRRIAAMKLELAGLSPDDADKMPAQLSGGMIKRAALARALALDPRILFLDEPTAALDPPTAAGIDELIRQLNRGLGVTVIVVTHDLRTLAAACDRVAVLVDGKAHVGTLAELERSDEPWIREFLHGSRAPDTRAPVRARRPASSSSARNEKGAVHGA